MPPPVCTHLVQYNSSDQGIEPAVLLHQRIAASTSDMKETVARVVDEPMHGVFAVDLIERDVAQARRAIGKRRDEFPGAHVVIGETLDQHRRTILLRQA